MAGREERFSCVLIGKGTLLARCGQLLLDRGHEIRAVMISDEPTRRWARESGLRCLDRLQELRDLAGEPFDFLFSIVNEFILPAEILNMPSRWAINYHDGPLPRYAGSHATSWALLNRESVHGVTWHLMASQVDAGDILKQTCFPIAPTEKALTLNAKCYEAAAEAFADLLNDLEYGRVEPQSQALGERVFFPKWKPLPAVGIISWSRPAEDIDALIRALDFGPYPNPLGTPKIALGNRLAIVAAAQVLAKRSDSPPGIITQITSDAITVATSTRDMLLQELLSLDGDRINISDLVSTLGLIEGQHIGDSKAEDTDRLMAGVRVLCRHEPYWLMKLADLRPAKVPLVARRAPGIADAINRRTISLRIPEDIIASLLATTETTSPEELLLATYAAYIARVNDDYTFDIAVKDQDVQNVAAGDGTLFAKMLPLRADLAEMLTLREVVHAIRRERETLRQHGTHLRDVRARYPSLRASGQQLALCVDLLGSSGRSQEETGCALTLVIPKTASQCFWRYEPRLVDECGLERLSRLFSDFVERLAQNPDSSLRDVPLQTEEERDLVLSYWNRTETEYPKDRCIHELFETQAKVRPDAIAAVCEEEQISYGELNRQASRLAQHLRQLGVQPETLVAISVPRSIRMVVGLLGILKAGGAFLPLDPALPEERLAFMLSDSQCKFVIVRQCDGGRRPFQDVVKIQIDKEPTYAGVGPGGMDHSLPAASHNLAYVIYTSGSTGKPKGCLLPHRGVVNWLIWMRDCFEVTHEDRILQKAPLRFDVSVWECFLPLIVGGQLVLAAEGREYDAVYLAHLMARQGVTLAQFVPSMLSVLLDSCGLRTATRLRHVMCGGEVLSGSLQRRFFKSSTAQLCNSYGPTETSIGVTMWSCQKDDPRERVPIGRPIANTQLYILDRWMRPVPVGFPGELYIGGDAVGRGYLNRPDLTARAFVANPFNSAQGTSLYKTGDMARFLTDGNIEFLGRFDDQIKIRGVRIEPGEVEAQLEQHPAVREAVVLVREDEAGNKRLVAYYTVRSHVGVVEVEALRRHLAAALPEYMVPSAYVKLDGLPITANSKLDRQALPAPERSAYGVRGYQAPVGEIETRLARIWAEVLGLERVGRHDDFFELGGHSLLAVRLVAQVERIFGKPLPLALLFQAPKLEQLAHMLRQKGWSAPSSLLVPLQSRGSRSPFFCVHGYGLINVRRYVNQDQPLYALIAHGLDGRHAPATIQEMASDYLREIWTIQPNGPYFLGGFSAGGLIAFEMAQQLNMRGQKVALLILFDPSEPNTKEFSGPSESSRYMPVAKLTTISSFISPHLSNLRHLTLQEKCNYLLERMRGSVYKAEMWFYLRMRRRIPSHLRQLYASKVTGNIREYRPQTYPGRVILFKTGEWSSDWRPAWESLATGGLEIYEISGKHTEIFADPYFHSWVNHFVTQLDGTSEALGSNEVAHSPHLISS